jgi:(1->4)-alpha-D-glucan 1-alpha-D-glucosylmutase
MNIISTYRLQFHKAFTFNDAASIVPYLHHLGITHVYASPYLKAVAGSTHGYDVIDHSQLNPEIGTEQDYRSFVAILAEHGMSQILDTVPNHMGVETNENQWWNDVLANGQKSKYADYFDIDWSQFSCRRELAGKVLLPVLGEPYGDALSKSLLKLKREDGKQFVHYYDRKFPISDEKGNENLNDLLSRQAYRLSYWRTANDEINYRRFFDITGLAALQMQKQDVFDAVHDFTFKLIADGSVAGLRVDHPDGLLDPQGYFERLQVKYQKDCPGPAAGGESLYISVEKILNGDETLSRDWPVAGTSGYDFLCRVNNLFIDQSNEPVMTGIYERFVQNDKPYSQWVYEKKCLVLDTSFTNDLSALANRLDALAQCEPASRDFTRKQLREALREVVACFPVYRSYVSSRGTSESDSHVVNIATDEASSRNSQIGRAILEFIRDSILLQFPVAEAIRPQQLEFAQRFAQLTSPVNAKGIEDTTFYIYNRLTSLNEVGGDPGRFGRSPDELHEYFEDRQKNWPLAMSSLSTHDTKRSEEVRARLNVLSEISTEWQAAVEQWETLNAVVCKSVHPGDRYLLYQTLTGAWPLAPMDDAALTVFVKRIIEYLQKAMREAKQRTSWVEVNTKYETAVTQCVKDLMDPARSAAFLADFAAFHNRIALPGLINSLAQTTLRLTAPGICDTYQGTDLWDFSLVDPDNRRPVDYATRSKMLDALDRDAEQNQPGLVNDLATKMEDGRIKLWVISRLLRLRRRFPKIFLEGTYERITVQGDLSSHAFAFSRRTQGQSLIVIVPRLVAAWRWGSIAWGGTFIQLSNVPAGSRYETVLSGQQLTAGNHQEIKLSAALADFPVAVLFSTN